MAAINHWPALIVSTLTIEYIELFEKQIQMSTMAILLRHLVNTKVVEEAVSGDCVIQGGKQVLYL